MESENAYLEAAKSLPLKIRSDVLAVCDSRDTVFEIRLTEGMEPLVIKKEGRAKGRLLLNKSDLREALITLTGGSFHSFQREISKGFIPLKGGHRAGIAGTAVYDEKGNIITFKDISSIVIRVANEVDLKENFLVEEIERKGLFSAIISGAPCSGKTTLLKDAAKKLASLGYPVVVVDERQELFKGALGCSLIKGMEKAKGIELAVRNLSPRVLICDEVSGEEEARKLTWALNSGVECIVSIHARDFEDFMKKKTASLLTSTHQFRKVYFLNTFPAVGVFKEEADLL